MLLEAAYTKREEPRGGLSLHFKLAAKVEESVDGANASPPPAYLELSPYEEHPSYSAITQQIEQISRCSKF